MAVDNAPLCVGVCSSFGNSERLKLLFGRKSVHDEGKRAKAGVQKTLQSFGFSLCQFRFTVNNFLLYCTHVLIPVYKVPSFVRVHMCVLIFSQGAVIKK